MADTKYAVTVDSTGAVKQIEDLDKAWEKLKKTGKDVETGTGTLQKIFSSLFGQFTVAGLATNAITSAWAGLKSFASSSIDAALEAEAAEHRLTTALEMTGRARAGGVKDLVDFAREQSVATLYTDEQIMATETLLAQMTKLDNQGIKNMTRGVMGLASVLGPNEGLEGATSRVVRALQGNAEGLSRVGIQIDMTLPKGEQLAQIMERLAQLYPRATAELETNAGAVKAVRKEWGEIKEAVGGFIIKLLDLPGVLKQVRLDMEHAQGKFGGLGDSVTYAEVKLQLLHGAMSGLRDPMLQMRTVALDLAATFKATPPTVDALVAAYLKGPAAFDQFMKILRETNAIVEKAKVATIPVVFSLEQAFKDLGVTADTGLKSKLDLARQALDAYLKTSNPAPGIAEALAKKVRELEAALQGTNFELSKTGHLVQKGFNVGSGFQDIEQVIEQVNFSLAKYKTTFGSLAGGELGKMIDGMGEYADTGENVVDVQYRINEAWTAMTRIEARAKIRELKKELDRMIAGGATAQAIEEIKDKIAAMTQAANLTKLQSWADGALKVIGKMSEAVSMVTTGMDAVSNQSQKNREIALDNEYQKRLAVIKATIKDETKKQKAIEALDAEYDIKRRASARDAAKIAKVTGIMTATVNTAEGVARALKDFPWPLSTIIGGIVGALGAIQIATIAAQPIPLAKGGILRKPVFSGGYEGGEAGPEAVIPLAELPRVVRSLNINMAGAAAGASITLNINSPLVTTSGLADADLTAAGTKLIRIVKGEFERLGKRRF